MAFKGSMWAWGAFIVTLIAVGLIYVFFDKIIQGTAEPTSGSIFYEAYFASKDKLNSFWLYLPFFVLIILVIGVIAISVRKKEGEI
jgi:heme/copper-type cytochrome/quinol oxidase subunit 2